MAQPIPAPATGPDTGFPPPAVVTAVWRIAMRDALPADVTPYVAAYADAMAAHKLPVARLYATVADALDRAAR